MPCNLVRSTPLVFERVAFEGDYTVLANALHGLGFNCIERDGILSFGRGGLFGQFDGSSLNLDRRLDADEIKRAYSREVVQTASEKYGWLLLEKSPDLFVAQRRT